MLLPVVVHVLLALFQCVLVVLLCHGLSFGFKLVPCSPPRKHLAFGAPPAPGALDGAHPGHAHAGHGALALLAVCGGPGPATRNRVEGVLCLSQLQREESSSESISLKANKGNTEYSGRNHAVDFLRIPFAAPSRNHGFFVHGLFSRSGLSQMRPLSQEVPRFPPSAGHFWLGPVPCTGFSLRTCGVLDVRWSRLLSARFCFEVRRSPLKPTEFASHRPVLDDNINQVSMEKPLECSIGQARTWMGID